MCLIFFSINEHPEYKMIIASNRDEFYNRQTAPAQFWRDHPHVLAGRDLEAMGTWMGITKLGKISMLTNYRDVKNLIPKAPSRGQLVLDYLVESVTPKSYLEQVMITGKHYNGFNLLTGTADQLLYYSNYDEQIRILEKGFYGLSNHLLDTPWPKIVLGKALIKPLFADRVIDVEKIFTTLSNSEVAADAKLPDTGLPLERERALSALFIKTSNYGSRCTTVLLIDKKNNVQFAERTYNLESFEFTTQSYQFTIG